MSNRTRKHWIVSFFFITSLLILGIILRNHTHKAVTKNRTQVRIGWQTSWATQGQLAEILQQTNALQLNNLDGSFSAFQYGAPLSEAAIANKVDVAFLGDQPAINLLAHSSDWTLVARLMNFRVAIIVPPDSTLHSVADLRGKTVSVPFGSSAHRYMLQALQQAGLQLGKDVTLINLDIDQQSSVIQSGNKSAWKDVQAFGSWDHYIAAYEVKGQARVLTEGRALGVIAMSTDFINRNPAAARDFLASFQLAYFYYSHHEDEANKWFSQQTTLSISSTLLTKVADIEPNLSSHQLTDINIDLGPKEKMSLEDAVAFATAQKLITSPIDLTKAINDQPAKAAKNILSNKSYETLQAKSQY